MEFKNWLQSVKDYMIDAGVKNPDAVIGKNKNLYNYFYLKKMLPEDVSLHFTDKLSKPTKADYLEILRNKKSSQGANYADSMVFYKGKVLGRCPSGTIRSGKTCVPGAPAKAKGPGYKTQDLGGLTPAQVKALSKAKSTEDIIEAHRKEEQND
jgi:hypothetical protein